MSDRGAGRAVTVLLLGGTVEGRQLATALHGQPGLQVVSSLAGRVGTPMRLAGQVRTGGFGGIGGLTAWLARHRPLLLVDATHPYAVRISAATASAAAATGTPALRLARPGWAEQPGDRWHRVPDAAGAAAVLPALGGRPLLTTGQGGLSAFTDQAGCVGLPVLVRCVDQPPPPLPAPWRVLLARGPFTLTGERDLLRNERIDVLVTRDSGGSAPKLGAAREAGVPVVVLDRPPGAADFPALPQVTSVVEAIAWVEVNAGVERCAVLRSVRRSAREPGASPGLSSQL